MATYDGGKTYLTTSLASKPDIMVNYMFATTFNIPESSMLTFKSEIEDLLVKARTNIIPGRNTAEIESNFMGSQQYFPGKTTYPHKVTITFEEFQDGGTHSVFKKWQDAIYNPLTGVRISNYKKNYSADIVCTLMGTDGSIIGEPIVFQTAWVSDVGEPSLSYDDSGKVVFEVTFTYDKWCYASEV